MQMSEGNFLNKGLGGNKNFSAFAFFSKDIQNDLCRFAQNSFLKMSWFLQCRLQLALLVEAYGYV